MKMSKEELQQEISELVDYMYETEDTIDVRFAFRLTEDETAKFFKIKNKLRMNTSRATRTLLLLAMRHFE